jgi:hypothetical protein
VRGTVVRTRRSLLTDFKVQLPRSSSRGCDVNCDPRHMLFLARSPFFRSVLISRRVLPPSTSLRFLAAMPPKGKRKATEAQPPPTKRVKKTDTMGSQMSIASTSASQVDSSGQPTNTQLPDKISFPERVPGTRRISAWNICSWAASNKKVRFQRASRYLRCVLINY